MDPFVKLQSIAQFDPEELFTCEISWSKSFAASCEDGGNICCNRPMDPPWEYQRKMKEYTYRHANHEMYLSTYSCEDVYLIILWNILIYLTWPMAEL